MQPLFDPREWVQLTPAFGQLNSLVGPRDLTETFFNRYLHEGPLELALMAPDGTLRLFDASECQELTVHAPHNFEEGCRIEPYRAGRWYVRRSSLDKLTTIPTTPAGRAEVIKSGAPGHPTSMHLVEAELDSRIVTLKPGELLGNFTIEVADQLSTWLTNNHPTKPQCRAKTIANKLGRKIRPHLAERPPKPRPKL
jgi:hypothetical protein